MARTGTSDAPHPGSPTAEPTTGSDDSGCFPEPRPGQADDLTSQVAFPNLVPALVPTAATPRRRGQVEFAGDRHALVAALRRGDEGAAAALFHEFAPLVERTIGRVLGVDDELPDATQEAFLRALRSVHGLRDPQALADWMLQIAVYTATDWVRRRKRRRWLMFLDPERLDHPAAPSHDDTGREALRATYRVLDRLSTEDRAVFALRFIDGMELTTLAGACDCSLATVKRRLCRATTRFQALARHERALSPWITAAGASPDEEARA